MLDHVSSALIPITPQYFSVVYQTANSMMIIVVSTTTVFHVVIAGAQMSLKRFIYSYLPSGSTVFSHNS